MKLIELLACLFLFENSVRSSSSDWPSGGELKPETSSDPPSNAQVGQATTPTSSSNQSYMTFNSNINSPSSLSTLTGGAGSNTGNSSSFSNLNGLVPNQSPNGGGTNSLAQFSASPPSPQFLPVNSNASSNTGNTSPSSPLPGSAGGNSNSSSNQNVNNSSSNASSSSQQQTTTTSTTTASSNFGSGSGSSKKKDKNRPQLADDEDFKETIKLFDGNTSFRNQIYRPITVSRNSSYQSILVSTRDPASAPTRKTHFSKKLFSILKPSTSGDCITHIPYKRRSKQILFNHTVRVQFNSIRFRSRSKHSNRREDSGRKQSAQVDQIGRLLQLGPRSALRQQQVRAFAIQGRRERIDSNLSWHA